MNTTRNKVTVHLTVDGLHYVVDLGNGFAQVFRARIVSASEDPLSEIEQAIIAMCEELIHRQRQDHVEANPEKPQLERPKERYVVEGATPPPKPHILCTMQPVYVTEGATNPKQAPHKPFST